MSKMYEGDFNYLRDELDIHPQSQRFEECLTAMKKYSSPWWYELKGDAKELAAMQMNEPVLLILMNTFKKGVEKVLGRKIGDNELSHNNTELKKEFEAHYQALHA